MCLNLLRKMNKISWSIWKYRNRYKTSKQIIFKKSLLQQDLCDYRDAYIVVKGTNTVTDPNDAAYDKN